jgi:hypothetical protein
VSQVSVIIRISNQIASFLIDNRLPITAQWAAMHCTNHLPIIRICAMGMLFAPAASHAFNDLPMVVPPALTYGGPGGGLYYDGSDLAGGFRAGPAWFSNDYNTAWGSWAGWAWSTTSDSTTPGWGNQYSAIAGPLAAGVPYAVAYTPASIIFDAGWHQPQSLTLTNTTYTALSMLHGDGFSKQFGGPDGSDPDWLLLTITAYAADNAVLATIEHYLADYRAADPADDYVLTAWHTVDLTPLGDGVSRLGFGLTSSDNGLWGMNTPAYFAVGTLVVVPEPQTVALIIGLLALGLVWWSGRARRLAPC